MFGKSDKLKKIKISTTKEQLKHILLLALLIVNSMFHKNSFRFGEINYFIYLFKS